MNMEMASGEDTPHEECGVVAVYAPNGDAARLAFYGLFALQHRGQESAGIASFDGKKLHSRKNIGLVSQVFAEGDIAKLGGTTAIGHTRYSTTGLSDLRNVQPFMVDSRNGPIALAHNGNIVNATRIRETLFAKGAALTSASDTELMVLTLAGAEGSTWIGRIREAMRSWTGAYSFVVLTSDGIFAARDRWGMRPLSWGRTPDGTVAFASETCALSTLGCSETHEVGPGGIVACDSHGVVTESPGEADSRQASCVFEFVYFSRPDSEWNGHAVHDIRARFGEELAKIRPVEADIVIPVPDSSISAAIGYASGSGIPYGEAFVKNRYIGRTFIEPTVSLRKRGVSLKYNVLKDSVKGKRVVVIDDSIVRGTTVKPLVALLRNAGAKEVHVRVASPPVYFPCRMGVDMGERDELIANRMGPAELAQWSGADSLAYLSLEAAGKVIGNLGDYCAACFSGEYPFPLEDAANKISFEF